MKKSIMSYINKLQSYRTAIKNIHWSSGSMSEHKLFDDIEKLVSSTQDEVAEMAQGIYGRLKLNDLRPKRYNISSSKKMLQDLLGDTKLFLNTLNRNKDLVGIKSVIEAFVGEINKNIYLLDFCLKEDLKRRISAKINESSEKQKQMIKLTENEFRNLISESIKRIIQ